MKPWARTLVRAVPLVACAVPLFAMTVQGWTSSLLYLAFLGATLLLVTGDLPPPDTALRSQRQAVVLALAAPLLATLFSAALRRDGYLPQFDAPLRLALAIPVFLCVARTGFDAGRWLRWVLPASLFIVVAHRAWFGQPAHWPEDRMTTAFVDPLVFGYLSLTFGLMGLMGLSTRAGRRSSLAQGLAGLVTLGLGLALSVLSGSRSGWLAIPLVLACWLHLNLPARWRLGPATVPLVTLAAVALLASSAYFTVHRVQERVQEAIADLHTYSFDKPQPETSLGYRITFVRIAGDLVARHPLAGVGDTAHRPPAPETDFPYATPEAVRASFHSAFHNQVVSDAVRHGLSGGLAALLLLLVPGAVCARHLESVHPQRRRAAALGLCFAICLAVSSLSTEVVDLKYTASLFALMTALLCGATLAQPDSRHGQD